jgi:colanic acid/amylovoran biosynthesis glycosyltransferase
VSHQEFTGNFTASPRPLKVIADLRSLTMTAIAKRTSAWWQPKLGMLMALCYAALALVGAPLLDGLLFCTLFLVSSLGFGLFGHLLNDLADEKQDIASRKPNLVAGKGLWFRVMAVLGSAVVACAPWTILPTDRLTLALLSAETFLFIVYALRPFRLKERGVAGLIADAAYAFAIPAVLVFHAAGLMFGISLPDGLIAVTVIWALSAGLFNITHHQLIDLESDAGSGQQTFAVTQGRATTMRLATKVLLPLHLLGFGVFAAFLSVHLGLWYAILPILLVAGKMSDLRRLLRISVPRTPHALQRINLHYHRFLPHWNILAAAVVAPSNLLLATFHAILFHGDELIFWGKKVQGWLSRYVLPAVIAPLRFIVNHGIYWFRRIVLRKDELSAHGDYAAQHLAEMEEAGRHQRMPHVALVNHNLDKYTETFVRRHLKELPFNMHLLYGGYLPTNAQREGDLISGNPALKAFLRFWATFRGLPADHHQKIGIASYLLRNNISLVLAEFGQSGAEMTPICRELGIPLICIFHGYDAYNVDVLEQRRAGYADLFSYASALVAVSLDIRERLIAMGAPSEKIHHLPCAPDLDAFPYSDHSANPPVVLTVGRFCTNKAPHVTILAFNEVLREMPEARLVMIGDGELKEACEILATSLEISHAIEFTGVLSPELVLEHMRNARVFVQHSVTGPMSGEKEGTPVAVMEAMACGLPVIATRHGGMADIISDGETGFLVKEYDHQGTASAILSLLRSESEVSRIGDNAARSLRENSIISKNIQILDKMVRADLLR